MIASDKSRLVVFAGPNGSGKSTLYRKLAVTGKIPSAYINADDIAREELGHIVDYQQRNMEAAKLAEQRRREAMAAGQSFAFETVMSTPGKLAILQEAKARGFQVELVFVTTLDASINVDRVANRAALGGHAVEPAAVRARYERTMSLLPSAVALVDTVDVFDNSGVQMMRVAMKRSQTFAMINALHAPAWPMERLVAPLCARESSRAEMHAACLEHTGGQPCIFSDASISHGQEYQGKVVAADAHYILQHIGERAYTIHDRALCPPMRFKPGKDTLIAYHYVNGGKHKTGC